MNFIQLVRSYVLLEMFASISQYKVLYFETPFFNDIEILIMLGLPTVHTWIIASHVSTTKCPSAGERLSEICPQAEGDTAESREVGLTEIENYPQRAREI